jgi:hypothetical protein
MRQKSISIIIGSCIIAVNLFSQPEDNNSASSFRVNNVLKKGNIEKTAGLGYFSDPAENLFDVYHYGNFPDSVYFYYNNNDTTGMTINGKYYFTEDSKKVSATSNDNSQDLYYYNETGLLDSAILESEADQEYDDYAIKHIYTYKDGLMAKEDVSVDHINDSVNDDWIPVQKIEYIYDANQRIKEKFIENLPWWPDVHFEKNVYYYSDSSSKGITQTDTCFVVSTTGEKIASQIVIKKFNSASLCIEASFFQFESYYWLKPDSFGTPSYVKMNVMEYDNNKALISEEIIYNYNAQPSGYKNIYEHNLNGTRKLKTVYQRFNNLWYLAYQYQYFYNLSETEIVNMENTGFHIFPNPVYDIIYFKGVSDGSKVSIYSTDGKLVKTLIFRNYGINISDLSKGAYILKVNKDKTQVMNKLFIKY